MHEVCAQGARKDVYIIMKSSKFRASSFTIPDADLSGIASSESAVGVPTKAFCLFLDLSTIANNNTEIIWRFYRALLHGAVCTPSFRAEIPCAVVNFVLCQLS